MSKRLTLARVKRGKTASRSSESKGALEAFNFVSGRARAQWYLNVGVQIYVLVTLLAVEDADFFAINRNTELPILGISVPTGSFFVFGGALCLVLFLSLHIHLQRLWAAVAALQAKKQSRSSEIQPWLVSDMILMRLGFEEISSRPLSLIVRLTSLGGIWLSAPILLTALWWIYMTSHQTPSSLFLGLLVSISILVSVTSWQNFRRNTSGALMGRASLPAMLAASIVLILVTTISWARTSNTVTFSWGESGPSITIPSLTIYRVPPEGHIQHEVFQVAYDQQSNFKRYIADNFTVLARIYGLAPIDLRNVELVPKPDDWRPADVQRRISEAEICGSLGYDSDRCDLIDWLGGELTDKQIEARELWCSDNEIDSYCLERFEWQDDWARQTWEAMRSRSRGAIPALDLEHADLRGADLTGAFLVGVNLSGARLDFATMHHANLEGANLDDAYLVGASAWGANFQRVHGWGSYWRYSTLYGSSFSYARLRGADYSLADIWHTDFRDTDLWGSGWHSSELRAVDYSNATFWGGSWQGATVDGVQLHGTDLRYVNGLTQMMLDQAIGDSSTVLTRRAEYDHRPNHRIAECWHDIPESVIRTPQRAGIVRFSYVMPIGWNCKDDDRQWHEATLPSAGTYLERSIPGDVEVRIWSDDDLRPFGGFSIERKR